MAPYEALSLTIKECSLPDLPLVVPFVFNTLLRQRQLTVNESDI